MSIPHRSPTAALAGLGSAAALAALLLGPAPATASAGDPGCVRAEQRLAQTGLGDPDDDGLSSCRERRVTKSNPRRADTDRDGADDGVEVAAGTAPRDPDSDDDGLDDGLELDLGTNPRDPDSDDDALDDAAELEHGTDPLDADSDDDGRDDGEDDDPTGDDDADEADDDDEPEADDD